MKVFFCRFVDDVVVDSSCVDTRWRKHEQKIHSKFFHVYQCQYQSPVSVRVPDMEYVCQVDGYVALLCVAVEIGSVTYG